MSDPFKITGPTCLSFSGGRTSAFMLWLTLQANTPADVKRWLKVCFANTGLEAEETLKFVERCSVEWDVPIRWLEYTGNEEKAFRVVNFLWAARNGEPFEALVRRRKFLPNPVSRFCTSELKIRTMHRYLRYFYDWPEWDQFIGIRADEQRRVSKIRARGHSTETRDETMCMPLADTGIGVQQVDSFWQTQSFKLDLTVENGRTLDGNCVYCFLKPPAQRLSLARQGKYPMTWWVRAEDGSMVPGATGAGARFTKDGPSYEQIERYAKEQTEMFDPDEEAIACFCGD
jgi:3'-phosphoadenosine 5'-phosphosulfate sulfotransferase (PAPS reductase)/FAD synthetase